MERSFRDKRNNYTNKNIVLELIGVFLISFITFLSLFITLHRDIVFAESIKYDYNKDVMKDILGINQFNIHNFPKVVVVNKEDSVNKYLTNTSTIEEFLNETGIVLESNQYTLPQLNSPVFSNMTINIYTINTETEIKVVDIPYRSIVEYSDEIAEGEKILEHKGTVGKKEIIIEHTYIDNEKTKERIIQERIVIQPKDRIEVWGKKRLGIQDCTLWDSVIDKYAPKNKYRTKNIWMRYIMRKESWCDSGQNTRNTYFGLYQFVPNTFRGYGGVDIYDGEDQIRIASKMYDACAQRQWGYSFDDNPHGESFETEFPEEYKEIVRKCGK